MIHDCMKMNVRCEDIFLRYIFPYFKGDMGSPRSVLSNDVNCQPLTREPDSKVRSVEIRQGNLLSLLLLDCNSIHY